MTDEEKIITTQAGKRNTFRVPDGYFEQFTERMMQRLPEQETGEVARTVQLSEREPAKTAKTSRLRMLRPYLAAAACLCFAVFGITFYMHQHQGSNDAQALNVQHSTQSAQQQILNSAAEEAYFEEAADYVMLDNAEIYAYLSEY